MGSCRIRLTGLGEILGRGLIGIHKSVGYLEALKLALDLTELSLNELQTLFNEIGGIDSHLVLVGDGLLVILLEEHIQHILGSVSVEILKREREDGSIIVRLAYHQT